MSIRLKDTANITAKSASSATSATKATQDSAGQQINTTYIKGLSVNGRTITYTKGDGSTGTITTQDTNTDTNTTYTLSKNGSTITLTGSDGKTTSVSDSNTTYSTGTTSTAGLTKLYTGVGTATDGTMTQAAMKTALDGKAASSHTHNYAGSSSAGGAANSANLLNITGGRATSANSAVIVGPNTSMMLSTSSMTTGKPASDGYITEYRWDNNGGWSSQLFVPNNPKGVLQYRSMNAGTWDNWNTVYSTCNPQTTITGNAGTATTLQTARTINGTSFNGSANITTANWGTARNIQIGNTSKSVNGSANVSWSLSEIGAAAASHTHNSITNQDTRGVNTTPTQMPLGLSVHLKSNDADGLYDGGNYHSTLMIKGWNDASGGPFAQMTVTANNNLYFRSSINDTWNAWKKVSLDGHTHNYAGSSSAGGAANTAVKLHTARTINGTNFDGTGNITTANWGTARNITIGNTAKSVNGSANVSWSLSEIGAAPVGYGLGTTCQDKSNQDCNNILVTGFYMGLNMTNKPSGCTQGWIYLLVMRHNDSWVRQVAYDFSTASQVYTRVKQNGNWTAWVATDTNTWRGVQDNLTSTATDQSLSANQGKVLKGLIDGKAASNHTHSYLPLSGGTLTGDTTFNKYIKLNAWPNYGTGTANIWYNGNEKTLAVENATNLKLSGVSVSKDGHTHNYAGSSSAGGNANAAVKLATARTINGTNFDGSANITTANWGTARNLQIGNTAKSVNGSANVTWSLDEIGARTRIKKVIDLSNTNTYSVDKWYPCLAAIPYDGMHDIEVAVQLNSGVKPSWSTHQGGFTCNLHVKAIAGGWGTTVADSIVLNHSYGFASANPCSYSQLNNSSNAVLWLRGGGKYFVFTDWNASWSVKTASTEISSQTVAPATSCPSISLTKSTMIANLSGNATTATTLQTTRTINGTNFNGSANITTANWGTARNIQIGNTTKSVNGSANVSWTLGEIGAAASNHTHSYLPLSGGTMTGAITVSGESRFHNGTYTDPWSGTSCAIKASGHVAVNGQIKATSTVTAPTFAGALSGNANTATKLATARTIKVGNTGKTFDGSDGITFTLADIGIVSGTSAPNNSDGRPDGTVYFKYA